MNPREQLANSRMSVLLCECMWGAVLGGCRGGRVLSERGMYSERYHFPPAYRKNCTCWACRLLDSQSQRKKEYPWVSRYKSCSTLEVAVNLSLVVELSR